MQRCMDLIFKLLEFTEEKNTCRPLPAPAIDGFTSEQIQYHVRLCDQAGYLTIDNEHAIGKQPGIVELTWHGHEMLEKMRSER